MGRYFVRGQYNDISNYAEIGSGTIISGFTYVGRHVKIGKNCRLANYVEINDGAKIGDETNLQSFVVINSETIIGKNCHFGPHVVTVDEKYLTNKTSSIKRKPCTVEDDVRIGAGAILISVRVGKGAIVGAGAVVMKDVPPSQVWAGVPARQLLNKNGSPMTRRDFEKRFTKNQKNDL